MTSTHLSEERLSALAELRAAQEPPGVADEHLDDCERCRLESPST